MDECDLDLSCGGINLDDTLSEQILSKKNRATLLPHDITTLHEMNIHTFGDLTEMVNGSLQWIDLPRLGTTFLAPLIYGRIVPQETFRLQQVHVSNALMVMVDNVYMNIMNILNMTLSTQSFVNLWFEN